MALTHAYARHSAGSRLPKKKNYSRAVADGVGVFIVTLMILTVVASVGYRIAQGFGL
jgi:hypothetical protein